MRTLTAVYYSYWSRRIVQLFHSSLASSLLVFSTRVFLIKLTVRSCPMYRVPQVRVPLPRSISPESKARRVALNPTTCVFYHFHKDRRGNHLKVQDVFLFVFYTQIVSHTFLTVDYLSIFIFSYTDLFRRQQGILNISVSILIRNLFKNIYYV